jgi:hypothetical protein
LPKDCGSCSAAATGRVSAPAPPSTRRRCQGEAVLRRGIAGIAEAGAFKGRHRLRAAGRDLETLAPLSPTHGDAPTALRHGIMHALQACGLP